MSIENNLERIANALEILAGSAPPTVITKTEEPVKAEKKTAAEKKAEKAAKAKAAREKLAADAKVAEDDGPSREDVSAALVAFCAEGPGKAAAKDVLEEFKAGSISTLDAESYGAFIARLEEVAEAAE